MKQLEIKTNKRLLIVEFPEMPEVYKHNKEFIFFKFKKENEYNNGAIRVGFEKIKEICKGPDLTEELAEEFSKHVKSSHGEDGFINYLYESKEIVYSPAFVTALESFISAIESKGYHWGENPVKFKENEMNWEKRHKNRIEWERAESRTFNPSKCIIFEIV